MVETTPRLGVVRTTAAVVLGIAIAFVILVAGVCVVAWMMLGGSSSPPTAHHGPSFRFGEKIMNTRVYGGSAGGPASLAGRCRYVIGRATDAPPRLDLHEAIAGCLYQEQILDN